MTDLAVVFSQWNLNRQRTLSLLTHVREWDDPVQALGWRPGPGRAHLAWQLLHIGITEELFATERLGDQSANWPELVERFRGGSTPDDDIPDPELIERVLIESRDRLIALVKTFDETDLSRIPPALEQRGWTVEQALHILAWHEPHHQGQAHITWNLFRVEHGGI